MATSQLAFHVREERRLFLGEGSAIRRWLRLRCGLANQAEMAGFRLAMAMGVEAPLQQRQLLCVWRIDHFPGHVSR